MTSIWLANAAMRECFANPQHFLGSPRKAANRGLISRSLASISRCAVRPAGALQQAIALISPIDGNIAHQADQIANKIAIPIVTLSSDATTTRISIPWIFRLGAGDADQAQLIATDIYRRRNLRKVLLIAEDDHDGRLALKNSCARRIYCMPQPQNAWISTPRPQTRHPLPTNLNRSDPTPSFFGLAAKPRAHCFPLYTWQFLRPLPIFRSKAAQVSAQSSQTWFSASAVSSTTEHALNFTKRYREQTARDPTVAAREIYDAVRLLASAVRIVRPNRARVRDYLASGRTFLGLSGAVSFDQAGNSKGEFVLQGAADSSVQAAF